MKLFTPRLPKFGLALSLLISAIFLTACATPQSGDNAGTTVVDAPKVFGSQPGIKIAVSIPPQQFLIERLTSGRAQVISLTNNYDDIVNPNLQITNAGMLNDAQLFVKIGAPFERKLSIPASCRVISMLRDNKLRSLSSHVNKLDDNSRFTGPDYYIWMSPSRIVRMLTVVYEQLREIDPEGADEYSANFARLTRDLNSVEGDVQRILLDKLSEDIWVDPPVLGYFCDDFGLRQYSAHIAGNNSGDLVRQAMEKKIKVILTTSSIGNVDAGMPSLLSGSAATINPMLGDYFNNLRNIARAIAGRSPGYENN